MTDAITNEIISKIQSLPKAEARKVIDAIKSLKLFDASFSDFITEKRFGTGLFVHAAIRQKFEKTDSTKLCSVSFVQTVTKAFLRLQIQSHIQARKSWKSGRNT